MANFFRFLAVGCVFLCINAALLYPDSAIPSSDEKLLKKETVAIQKPFKKSKASCLKEELQKCKLCLGQIINGRKETSFNDEARTDLVPNEWVRLIKNTQKTTDLSPTTPTNMHICNASGKTRSHVLTRTKTVLDLSEKQSPASHVLHNCCDVKRVTYAECPRLSSKDNEHLCEVTNPESPVVEVGQNDHQKSEQEISRGVQKACQKRDQEIQPKCAEKACEIKEVSVER